MVAKLRQTTDELERGFKQVTATPPEWSAASRGPPSSLCLTSIRLTCVHMAANCLSQLLEAGHGDLVAHQPQIAPLRAAVTALLQGSDLDIASRGDAVQRQCTEMLNKLAVAKAQVQPGEAPSAEWLFSLQLLRLSSSILQPRHAADMSRFFKDVSLVSQRLPHAAKSRSELPGTRPR